MRTLGALLLNCASFFLLAPHFALAQVPAAIASASPPAKLPPKCSPNRIKQLSMYAGTDTAYELARKYNIKTAWGTDILFSAANFADQTKQLSKMVRWYAPAEILKMATADDAELLALSGERSPYQGKLGVIDVGALADIKLLEDADKNLAVIMKDGKIYKKSP